MKNVFEKGGGSLAGPGAVSFNFESKGLCVVNKSGDLQSQILSLIDLGIEDYLEETDSIEVYVQPEKTAEIKDNLEKAGFQVTSAELVKRPLNYQVVSDPNDASRALKFLDTLEEDEDVQKVFTNLDIPDDIVNSIKNSA
jgi:transcriptional/translational regulatory protein YebC/TACO1